MRFQRRVIGPAVAGLAFAVLPFVIASKFPIPTWRELLAEWPSLVLLTFNTAFTVWLSMARRGRYRLTPSIMLPWLFAAALFVEHAHPIPIMAVTGVIHIVGYLAAGRRVDAAVANGLLGSVAVGVGWFAILASEASSDWEAILWIVGGAAIVFVMDQGIALVLTVAGGIPLNTLLPGWRIIWVELPAAALVGVAALSLPSQAGLPIVIALCLIVVTAPNLSMVRSESWERMVGVFRNVSSHARTDERFVSLVTEAAKRLTMSHVEVAQSEHAARVYGLTDAYVSGMPERIDEFVPLHTDPESVKSLRSGFDLADLIPAPVLRLVDGAALLEELTVDGQQGRALAEALIAEGVEEATATVLVSLAGSHDGESD